MIRRTAITLFLLLAPLPVYAEGEEIDCSASCPEGEVLVSFTDGNDVTCICQPAAEMDPTVPDTDIEDVEQTS